MNASSITTEMGVLAAESAVAMISHFAPFPLAVSPPSAAHMVAALSFCAPFQHPLRSGISIGDHGAACLSTSLAGLTSLQSLNVRCCSAHSISIALSLSCWPSPISHALWLDLSSCRSRLLTTWLCRKNACISAY